MILAIKKNAVAVITGAAMGIGYAIAERMAQEGMKLVLLDKDPTLLAAAIKRLRSKYRNVTIHPVVGDVSSERVIDQLHHVAVSTGEVGVIVNNAAIHQNGNPWGNVSAWQSLMNVNFWAILRIQEKFMPTLMNQQGHSAIVNVGSKEGITTPPGNAAYSVSKAAVRVLTEQLAHELRESVSNKISTHLLIPGYTFTPMNFPGITFDSVKPKAAWSPRQVADRLLEGMRIGEFYIFCEDNEVTKELDQLRIQWSTDDMIKNRPALSRWHPEFKEEFDAFIQPAKLS